MNPIDYKTELTNIINSVNLNDDFSYIPKESLSHLDNIGRQIENQKGVFTVLVTLFFYKIYHPDQDIRFHQDNMENGFSGRSFDTRFITPILKEYGFPSMSESGWLTRSLEQPYPYTLNYNGKIKNKEVKKSFLQIIDDIQEHKKCSPKDCVKRFIYWCKKYKEDNKIIIHPLENPETLTVDSILRILKQFFETNYKTSGGSKLPVISLYTLFQIITQECKRYDSKELRELGFHTTCDNTSKSSGDIEIIKEDGNIFESIEIKFGIEIDLHILNIVIDKIIKYNPTRYYILSTESVPKDQLTEICRKIDNLRNDHGCHIIIDGIYPTLNYYLRLVSSLELFLNKFTENLIKDTEIKNVHRKNWEMIINSFQK